MLAASATAWHQLNAPQVSELGQGVSSPRWHLVQRKRQVSEARRQTREGHQDGQRQLQGRAAQGRQPSKTWINLGYQAGATGKKAGTCLLCTSS